MSNCAFLITEGYELYGIGTGILRRTVVIVVVDICSTSADFTIHLNLYCSIKFKINVN